MNPDNKSNDFSESMSLEKILEERERLENILKKKFIKKITVMFTDLKDSISFSENNSDITTRTLLKYHNEILFSIIQKNNGVLVKTMGDGTLSYFEEVTDALYACIDIQRSFDEFNKTNKAENPMLVRIGLHTGEVIVEKNDIFGDVVNMASRFENTAEAGEICFSEDTYNDIKDNSEFSCIFKKTSVIKGRKEVYKIYKLLWKEEEIDKCRRGGTPSTIPLLIQSVKDQPREILLLSGRETVIGNSNECGIVINGKSVSKREAKIFEKEGDYIIENIEGAAELYVNGKKTMRQELRNGDDIIIGDFCFTFVQNNDAALSPEIRLSRGKENKDCNERQKAEDSPETKEILRKAGLLEKNNELIELFFYCLANKAPLAPVYLMLTSHLEKFGRINTRFNGEEKIWYFKESLILGRIKEADHYISNKAISRVPFHIGFKGGLSYIRMDCSDSVNYEPVEIVKSGIKEMLKPGVDYPLDKRGLIIFSTCFPLEYEVYENIFLFLRFLHPGDCLRKKYNIELHQVWSDFELETRSGIVIGK